MSDKWLFHFDVMREVKEVKEEKTTNENGEEVITKKEVRERKPVTFSIKKPNRKLYEEGEMFYAVKLSEGIKAGLLTKPLLAKRYKDDGGPLSDDEKSRYAELFYELAKKQDDLEKLKLNLENKDEETREKIAQEILAQIFEVREELQEYEMAQSTLFDQTAENRAKNQTIMWWVLNLAYSKDGEIIYNPVFGEGSYEDMLSKYDELEDSDDPFWTETVKKFAYFVTFWYLNGISDEKEFKEVENIYKAEMGIFDEYEDEEESEEVKSEEEKPAAKKKPRKKRASKKQTPKEEAKLEEPKAEEKTEEVKEETKEVTAETDTEITGETDK
tara:strand:- start:11402 stop:12388 length:987 start_codon:yes stop_codon:yes gene_type:complete